MLEFLYVSIFVILVAVIYIGLRKALKTSGFKNLKKVSYLYFLGLFLWLIYLFLISYNGFIYDKSLPPRFLIFVFIPLIIFMFIFFYSSRNSKIYEFIPKSWSIYYQSFRVVMELIILMTFYAGIIPIQATFEGYNFELIFAITSPILGYLIFVKQSIPIKYAILWNIVGITFLIIVVSIMVSSYFIPEIWGTQKELIDISFTKLPLLLLPAFMVPSAIFVHIFSIIQILKEKLNNNLVNSKK